MSSKSADVSRSSTDSKVARALAGPAGAGGNNGGCGSGHESPPWIADGRVCIHCNNSSKPEREIMGKFAELCKGKTMGAFFLLLLRPRKMFGHNALLALGHAPRVRRLPVAQDSLREPHVGRLERLTRVGQHLPPPDQRFVHQATPGVIQQIE